MQIIFIILAILGILFLCWRIACYESDNTWENDFGPGMNGTNDDHYYDQDCGPM